MALQETPDFKFESSAANSPSSGDSGLNLLSVAGNPFQTNYKAGPSEMLARNCSTQTRDCSTPDVPQPLIVTPGNVGVDQRTNVGVDQTSILNSRQDTNVGVGIDQNIRTGNQTTDVRTGDQSASSSSRTDVNIGDQTSSSSSRSDVNVGDQTATSSSQSRGGDGGQGGNVNYAPQTRVDARALGLARSPILVNQCTDLAVQLGGGSGFIHADVGFMTANDKCMDAILTTAQCSGVKSLAEANVLTAQSALMFRGNEQYGMNIQRQIAQTTLNLAEQCAGVTISGNVAAPPPEAASKQDLQRLEQNMQQGFQETDVKINRAFDHTMKK